MTPEAGAMVMISLAFAGWFFLLEQRLGKKLDRDNFDEAMRRERDRLDHEAQADRDHLEKRLDDIRDRMEQRDQASADFKESIRDELHALNIKLSSITSVGQ